MLLLIASGERGEESSYIWQQLHVHSAGTTPMHASGSKIQGANTSETCDGACDESQHVK